MIVSKYADHLPLYRQTEIYARNGLDLDRALLAEWVGQSGLAAAPACRSDRRARAGRQRDPRRRHAGARARARQRQNEDRALVDLPARRASAGRPCAPGRALPLHARPQRRAGPGPPEHVPWSPACRRLCRLRQALRERAVRADGRPAGVTEVACWAHVRRGFFDVHKSNGSSIAREALVRIGALFDIERTIAGVPSRAAAPCPPTPARGRGSTSFAVWIEAQLKRISGKSDLAAAIRYARSRWDELTAYVDDGRLEISNNAAENAIRPVALGRKNWLFAGSDRGGDRAAVLYTLIRTAKLNGIEPEAYLRDVLGRIGAHPLNRLDELLPWNIKRPLATPSVAA